MIFKRRKSESCVRLMLPSSVILCTVLLTVTICSSMNVFQRRLAPRSEKAVINEDPLRSLTKSGQVDSSSAGLNQNQAKSTNTKSASSVSSDETSLMAVLSRFQSRLAFRIRPVVNTHNFDYTYNVPQACAGKTVELMIAALSRVNSFTRRQTIRETWGQFATGANKTVLLFFLGSTTDKNIQEKVAAEAQKHGDIVQETFIDSYRNLSLKSVALVRWVSLYCPDSTFVLKADDDMYINVPRLLSRLRAQFDKAPLFIMGFLLKEIRPIRTEKHKWYLSTKVYPERTFPNYVCGTAYAMTTTAALRLYVESFYVRLLFLEDVYLTGILADKASVPRISESTFSPIKIKATGCTFKTRISGHRNSPTDMRKIHAELFDPNLKCEK